MPSRTAVAPAPKRTRDPAKLLELVVDAVQDIKANGLVSLDLREIEDSPAAYFVICQGESAVQVRAIAENVRRRARNESGERASSTEGSKIANWVCIDFFDVVVHVFNPDARTFYDLESLWSDAPATHYADA